LLPIQRKRGGSWKGGDPGPDQMRGGFEAGWWRPKRTERREGGNRRVLPSRIPTQRRGKGEFLEKAFGELPKPKESLVGNWPPEQKGLTPIIKEGPSRQADPGRGGGFV